LKGPPKSPTAEAAVAAFKAGKWSDAAAGFWTCATETRTAADRDLDAAAACYENFMIASAEPGKTPPDVLDRLKQAKTDDPAMVAKLDEIVSRPLLGCRR
jgi:hypothetical protein